MKNYESRLQALMDKLNPKTSLFQLFATKSNGDEVLIKESVVPRFKNRDKVKLIFGRGIWGDDETIENESRNIKPSE
jgi:hypothetical protein